MCPAKVQGVAKPICGLAVGEGGARLRPGGGGAGEAWVVGRLA